MTSFSFRGMSHQTTPVPLLAFFRYRHLTKYGYAAADIVQTTRDITAPSPPLRGFTKPFTSEAEIGAWNNPSDGKIGGRMSLLESRSVATDENLFQHYLAEESRCTAIVV